MIGVVREDELDLTVVSRCEFVANLLHTRPDLAATLERGRASRTCGVTLTVAGGPAEVQAWRSQVGGRIRPHFRARGMWSQQILADGIHITVQHRLAAA